MSRVTNTEKRSTLEIANNMFCQMCQIGQVHGILWKYTSKLENYISKNLVGLFSFVRAALTVYKYTRKCRFWKLSWTLNIEWRSVSFVAITRERYEAQQWRFYCQAVVFVIKLMSTCTVYTLPNCTENPRINNNLLFH